MGVKYFYDCELNGHDRAVIHATMVEHVLAAYLWHTDSLADGYELAANYCQNYDPQYGNGVNGPSRTKIVEIIRFMFTIEAVEDAPESRG